MHFEFVIQPAQPGSGYHITVYGAACCNNNAHCYYSRQLCRQ